MKFSDVYSKFLSTIKSCTLANFSPQEIEDELFDLITLSIAEFKFPKISLAYEFDEEEEEYYFVEEPRDAEIRVLIAIMRANWVSYQLTQEQNFDSQYYDSNTRTYSKANMIAQLEKLYSTLLQTAKQLEYDYNRVALDGTPQIGQIEW